MRQGSPSLKNRKRTSSDYQSRKDQVLKQLKLQYEIKMSNQPIFTNIKESEIYMMKQKSNDRAIEEVIGIQRKYSKEENIQYITHTEHYTEQY
jgi:hypothetical protein